MSLLLNTFFSFLKKEDYLVPLVDSNKIGTPIAVIPFETIWYQESLQNRIISLVFGRWKPKQNLLNDIAHEIFIEEVFGGSGYLAEGLFDLAVWHFNQNWELNHLTDDDVEKAKALEAMTLLTKKRYLDFDYQILNLDLAKKTPMVSMLICPIIAKIPIISIQYFVDIQIRYAFNSIRKSEHLHSNQIIAYLYEILILQQKTAISFHSLVQSFDNLNNTDIGVMHKNQVDATINIDSIIINLKSSIEKTIALIAYTFNITNIENKKTHKAKIQTLNNEIPNHAKEQYYYKFIEKFISSEQIKILNDYRTGQFHKKGISRLQPHSYYGKDYTLDLSAIFHELHEQYSKNSAVIISVMALLTDELVKKDRPNFSMADIPCGKIVNGINGKKI